MLCSRHPPYIICGFSNLSEQADLVKRQAANQGRAFHAYLTAQGQQLLEKGDRVAEQIEAQVFAGFSTEEQEQFNQHLLRCLANVEQATQSDRSTLNF